ncbi:MAG TPA: hypothetical protein VF704_03410 [Allosphingosinicella sp.]|jgi:hypothetical protein
MRRFTGPVAALLLVPAPATAQELAIPPVDYPALPVSAASAEAFVPAGWRIDALEEGDLNGDGADDLAFVLREQDPANVIDNAGFGPDRFDTNPRMLAVALAERRGGYRLVAQNHRLIPRHTEPVLDDPFDPEGEALKIERGTLKLSLIRFASAGGWDSGGTAFTFRWQDGALRLIGFDWDNVQRASGETREVSINFLTRRVRSASGNIERDDEQVRWSRIPAGPLPTLDEIGDGLEFDPGGILARLP